MGRAEDRLSYLPDPLIQTILAMMPLKSAIRTDVLSKKWRNLWKYCLSTATALDFSGDFASNQSAKDFVETLNRYILLNESKKLERFHVFFCPFDLFRPDIENWISFAVRKRVKDLDINLSQGFRDPKDGEFTDERSPFDLPSSLFDCESLVDLSLSRCDFSSPLNLSNFGGLQSLSISHSNIDEDMLQSILSECCLLQSLSLSSCQQLGNISITNADLNLKRLVIGDCWLTHLLEINAPNLQSFHYFGGLCSENNFSDISGLVDALISSIGRKCEHDYIDLLSDLSHVQILTLCTATLVVIPICGKKDSGSFIRDFTYFCKQLPKLMDDPNEQKHAVRVRLNPSDLDNTTLDHLKVIKVTNFKGCINEMRLVSFLLQKAAVLETLVLVLPPDKGRKGKEGLVLRILSGQVSLLPKASLSARIILHEFGEDDGLNPTHAEIYNDYSCLPVIPRACKT